MINPDEITVEECLQFIVKHHVPQITHAVDGRYYTPDTPTGWQIKSLIEDFENVIKYLRILDQISYNVVDIQTRPSEAA